VEHNIEKQLTVIASLAEDTCKKDTENYSKLLRQAWVDSQSSQLPKKLAIQLTIKISKPQAAKEKQLHLHSSADSRFRLFLSARSALKDKLEVSNH